MKDFIQHIGWVDWIGADGDTPTPPINPADWWTTGVGIGDAYIFHPGYQNMYQDAAGTSPVTADGQTVARVESEGYNSDHVFEPGTLAIDARTVGAVTHMYWPFANGYLKASVQMAWYSTWTVGACFRLEANASGTANIIMRREFITARDIIGIDATENLRIYDGAGAVKGVVGHALNIDQWYALVFRADGTNFDVWIDGTKVLSTTGTAHPVDFSVETQFGSNAGVKQYSQMSRVMYNTTEALPDEVCSGAITEWLQEGAL